MICKTTKPTDLQLSYKKIIGFTPTQKRSLDILATYRVNINQFIRAAVKEKIKRDWPQIKQEHTKVKLPF